MLAGRLALTVGKSVERFERRIRVVPIDGVQRIVRVDLVDRIKGVVGIVTIDRICGVPRIDTVNGVERIRGIYRIDRVQGIVRAQLIDRIEDVVVALILLVEAELSPGRRGTDEQDGDEEIPHQGPWES